MRHQGNGTLTLKDVDIEHGAYRSSTSASLGGCVYSSGNLNVQDSTFNYCRSESTTSARAEGGVMAALGNVTLDNTIAMHGYAVNTGDGSAYGGIVVSEGNASLNNTLLAYGSAQAYHGGNAGGGGLVSIGTTVVQGHSVISGNTADAADGIALGGGLVSARDMQVNHSQVSGNTTYSQGGLSYGGGLAITTQTTGALSTNYSSIAGNTASTSAGYSYGGGIFTKGDASLHRTTISGNTAEIVGGMVLAGSKATQALAIIESTVSGNVSTASSMGAGIFLGYHGRIANSTITANIESNANDNIYGAGLSVAGNTQVDLVSNIISGNSLKLGNGSLTPSDINAANGGSNVSLSGDVNLIGFVGPSYPPNSIVSDNPGLEPLADNGGPTMTHALKPSSLAVDAGDAGGDTTDQRGGGFDRVVGARADVGAFELGNDRIFVNGFESP